jgi:DNA-binding PadR family transcriptional regulator
MYGTIHTRDRGHIGRRHHAERSRHGHRGRGHDGRGPIRLQMRRGAVRDAILRLLAEDPMHGYQVMQELDARSDGRWHPSAGSIYPTLQQLEDEGLVSATVRDGRRTFALTDAGRAAVETLSDERPWAVTGRGDDLRGLARELGIAASQVTRAGSSGAVDEARRVLTDARKTLYRILAEDDAGPAATEVATSDDATSDDATFEETTRIEPRTTEV